MSQDRAVFTIATGKPIYLEMAFALARSFRLWHRGSDIRFFLATDAARESLPQDLRDLDVVPLQPGQYGRGFSPKLHLDEIAPAERSLFVDADCLCVGSLEKAFASFQGHPVSVVGREISNGEWFGDVAAVCRRFNVAALPRFNGGIYYLERGETCSRVYQTARELEPRYDEIGFTRLRGHPNDEVLVALAMALHGQKPIAEKGDIMNSLLAGPGGLELDVFGGKALLKNPKAHPKHNPWYALEESRPKLVHFLGTDISTYPYRQEVIRLKRVGEKGWPVWAATLWVKLVFSWPWQSRQFFKNLLRPLYRALFGARSVQSSSRG
jgi:hypothetical protein